MQAASGGDVQFFSHNYLDSSWKLFKEVILLEAAYTNFTLGDSSHPYQIYSPTHPPITRCIYVLHCGIPNPFTLSKEVACV